MRRPIRPEGKKPMPSTEPAPKDRKNTEPQRDAEGLIVDEYSDASFVPEAGSDALDRKENLVSDERLEDAENTDGIEEIEDIDGDEDRDTVDEGAPRGGTHRSTTSDILEAHSPDELKERAIGHELHGRAGVTRDNVVHGEGLLDSPDGPDNDSEDEKDARRR